MHPIDIVEWALAGAAALGVLLVIFRCPRSGYGLVSAAVLAVAAILAVEGASAWEFALACVALVFCVTQFGRALRRQERAR